MVTCVNLLRKMCTGNLNHQMGQTVNKEKWARDKANVTKRRLSNKTVTPPPHTECLCAKNRVLLKGLSLFRLDRRRGIVRLTFIGHAGKGARKLAG